MELTCPSCSIKHKSEDYPDAFEILCVCGYSILVPDVAAFHQTQEAPGFTSRSPTSQEEEEQPLTLPPEMPEMPSMEVSNEMTPPDELPKEMPYDPFELAQMNPSGDMPAPSIETPPSAEEENSPPAPATAMQSPPPALKVAPKNVEPAKAAPAQRIVERSQAASMGQLLGIPFDVRAEGLEREALVRIAKRCQKLLKGRPWLENELRLRKIDLEKIPDLAGINGAPEMIAVEFYLAVVEERGRCGFSRSSESASENLKT